MDSCRIEIFRPTDRDYRLRLWDAGGALWERDLERAELERLLAASETLYAGGAASRATLGQDLYRWLDGPTAGWLAALRETAGDLALHISCDEGLRHLPWELLQDQGVPLCAEAGLVPVRRVCGRAGNGGPAANRPLRLLFMAASPMDVQPVLAFEQEEARILEATHSAGLELVVEESGRLDGLREWIDGFPDTHFDVVHLSGHADVEHGRPVFLCEDAQGRAQRASAADIAEVFAASGRFPRLLFLSGCRTGQAPAAGVLPSLSEALVRAGVPAVLGWALPVGEATATQAAAEVYDRLANGVALDRAVERARQALYRSERADWSLLRLYSDAAPLVPLVTPRRNPGRTPPRQLEARQRFLDAGGQVEVCPRERFVGRRRALQQALRVLPAMPGSPGHAEGVLLHGMGGLGKSSLAARICDRLAATHAHWVWVGRLDEIALRRRIREALPGSAVLAEIDRRGLALPAWLQALLETALARPVLFVLDDFEHNLQAGEQGGEWAHPEARRCLHALLEALHRAGSESRVIVTSRLTFPLEHPERLAPIPLTAFRDADLRKKIERLEQLRDEGATPAPLRAAAIALGAGNPRLLERLDTALGTAGLDHAALLERLQQARAEFREQLLLRTLVDWLESADRRFLARAALYRLPVPREALAAAGELPDPAAHLRAPIALGLLEPGRLDYGEELYLVPELVADLLVPELDEDSRRAALAAAAALYRLWWTDSASRQWERVTETRRLALEAGQAEAVARTTEWLTDQLLYANEARTAQGLCREALALGDDAMVWLNLGRAGQFLGDGEAAGPAYERALALLPRPKPGDARERDYAAVLFHASGYAAQSGNLPLAESRLRETADILERLGDVRSKAVTQGQIADILQARGQLDEALRIRREDELPVYERLGDVRSKAVTQGYIADILQARGQLDEALRIRREDQLPVYERLGDVRSKAVALFNIAQIELGQERFVEALGDLTESYDIAVKLKIPDGLAAVGGLYGQLLFHAGERERGLAVLETARDAWRLLGQDKNAVAVADLIAGLRGGPEAPPR